MPKYMENEKDIWLKRYEYIFKHKLSEVQKLNFVFKIDTHRYIIHSF